MYQRILKSDSVGKCKFKIGIWENIWSRWKKWQWKKCFIEDNDWVNGAVGWNNKIRRHPSEKGQYAKDVGIVLDCIGFMPEYTAKENLLLLAKINKKTGEERINEILKQVGLEPDSKRFIVSSL